MNKKNLGNQYDARQKIENNKTNIYHRCSSVENKLNNPFFTKDLEKEYLDIEHLVKNSVEKINVLFNNEEFKQKTSKKFFQNNMNKININKFNFNKQDTSFDLLKKEDEKTDDILQDNNVGKVIINNQEASISEIQTLIQQVTNEMILLHTTIESMTEEEIIWQYIRIFWYRKKGLSQLLGESWEPPCELCSRLNKTKSSSKKSTSRPSREDVEKQYDYS